VRRQEAAGSAFPIFERVVFELVVFEPAEQTVWERVVSRLGAPRQAQA
jgi:hypothetical protein